MAKKYRSQSTATLHLLVEFESKLADALEAAKEIVEKAREQGHPTGFFEVNRVENIDIDELG